MKLYATLAALVFVAAYAPADSLMTTATKLGKATSAALAHKDFKRFEAAIRSHATTDFKYTESGNSMNLSQMVASVKGGVSPFNEASAGAKVLTCTQQGKLGKITSRHSVTGTMIGKGKKPHKVVASIISKDTWVKSGGAWKISSMVVVSQSMTIDGKPIDPLTGTPRRQGATRPRK